MTRSRSRLWHAVALVTIVLVPPSACGGIVALRDQDASTDAHAPTSTTPSGTGSATPTATGTASGTATPTPTGTPSATPTTTGTGSTTASNPDAGFGPFPCLAYTVWHESCPPAPGTAGCFYTVPADSADPANGWTNLTGYVAPPGCKLDITLPAANQCESAHCFCGTDDKWEADTVDAGQWPCPSQ